MNEETRDLTRDECLELLYQVAEDVHSLNQPLTTLFGQLDLLELKMQDSEFLPQIHKCIGEAEKLAGKLTEVSRKYPRRPQE